MLSTTATRTKQVVIKRMAGARLSTVSSSITWIVELSPSGLTHFSGPAENSCGTLSPSGRLPASSARAAAGASASSRIRTNRVRRWKGCRETTSAIDGDGLQTALTPCPSPILPGTAGGRGEFFGQPPRRRRPAPPCQYAIFNLQFSICNDSLSGMGFLPAIALASRAHGWKIVEFRRFAAPGVPGANCWKTWRKAVVALLGWACWQMPAMRSTSSGSVTSVKVSVPPGVIETSSSLLPQRSSCTCWRAPSGAGRGSQRLPWAAATIRGERSCAWPRR